MDILKEIEKEIKYYENENDNDLIVQNRISILKSILKIKKDNEKGTAYKKMLYLLLVKISIALIDLQYEEVITLDASDMEKIANNLGDPDASVDALVDLVKFLLGNKFIEIYYILNIRDDLIGLIYERLILEKR